MSDYPSSQYERDRQAALKEYNILDTAAEQTFDDITQLASLICDTPVSLMNFIDENRQWSKAGAGIDPTLTEMPREMAFCNQTILHDTLYEIPDMTQEPLFVDSPLVKDTYKVRFYAGVPLINPEGFRLGALCVLDMKPKVLTDIQKKSLESLAKIVVDLLETKRLRIHVNLLSQVYEMTGCNIFQFDLRTWVCDYANANVFRNTQFTQEEIAGKNLQDFFPDIADSELHEIINLIVSNELPFFYTATSLLTKAKEVIPVDLYLTLRKTPSSHEIVIATINKMSSDIELLKKPKTSSINKTDNKQNFDQQAALQKDLDLTTTEKALRQALQNNEFLIYYQPITNINESKVSGCEALLRWRDGNGKISLPLNFIKVAEATGLILEIGDWVLQEVTAQIAEWKNNGISILPVAINLSSHQFKQDNLVKAIIDIVSANKLAACDIVLELTESAIVQDYSMVSTKMEELREAGFKFSLDDFGTGYSSLSYLTKFPLDKIKIDKSFVADITTNSTSPAIIKTIINLAKNLKLSVVAEGVETHDQFKFLKKFLCDEIQGYLISKPVSAEDFECNFLCKPLIDLSNK
jgi:EAL domain-containing protein (putative c-di-GMP-specific phosphodiesterase class I)